MLPFPCIFDADGVALVAIQGLKQELESENAELRTTTTHSMRNSKLLR